MSFDAIKMQSNFATSKIFSFKIYALSTVLFFTSAWIISIFL